MRQLINMIGVAYNGPKLFQLSVYLSMKIKKKYEQEEHITRDEE